FRATGDEAWHTTPMPFYELLAEESVRPGAKKHSFVTWMNYRAYNPVAERGPRSEEGAAKQPSLSPPPRPPTPAAPLPPPPPPARPAPAPHATAPAPVSPPPPPPPPPPSPPPPRAAAAPTASPIPPASRSEPDPSRAGPREPADRGGTAWLRPPDPVAVQGNDALILEEGFAAPAEPPAPPAPPPPPPPPPVRARHAPPTLRRPGRSRRRVWLAVFVLVAGAAGAVVYSRAPVFLALGVRIPALVRQALNALAPQI